MLTSRSPKDVMALVAVCLSALMFGLEISSVPAILPTLQAALPARFAQLQWIMNAYTIAMTACLMVSGAMADHYGRKRIFMAGVAVFGVASIACGAAATAGVLIAARFVQGASGAAMLACQIALLSHQFPEGRARSVAFGWWGIVFGAGLGFGPLIGGLTAALLDWRWVFLVHVGLAVVVLVLARRAVAESRDPFAARMDRAGALTLLVGVSCLVYLITRGEKLALGDPPGLGLAALGALSLCLFVMVETRAPRPMFDFAAFRNRRFAGALLGSVGMNFSFWPFVIYLPIYFQAVLGDDSVTAGLALLAYTLPTLVAPPLGERLLLRHGPRFVIPFGLFIIGSGFAVMWVAVSLGLANRWPILAGCLVAGTGLGLMNTPVTNTATAALELERAGMASGMDMTARMVSLAVNIAVMGLILLQGIRAGLGPELAGLAQILAAGDLHAAQAGGVDPVLGKLALARGIGWTMLYAGASAWALSAASGLVLSRTRLPAPPADRPDPRRSGD